MSTKKLIEVALPLDKINEAAAYEKMPGIGAHPRGLHLWWARRPLTTARAVIWASMIDDPSSHPELFPSEEEQNIERQRLFKLLKDLVDWKNSKNEKVILAAREELEKKYKDGLPALLDPFSGGGAIPVEAQRLGLQAYAHDLDPISVMINKAMIDIPARFCGKIAVNPSSRNLFGRNEEKEGTQGLSEDVKYYGYRMLELAKKRIGNLYPKVNVPNEMGGGTSTVVAWLWARTIQCPNPACGCEMPLVRSFTLCKKKGRIAWVEPIYENKYVSFRMHNEGKPELEGTVNRKGAKCACCGTPVAFPHIRDEGKAGRMKAKLLAVVAEGKRGKIYLSPDIEQELAADISRPEDYPDAVMANNPRNFNTPIYGMNHFADLFTNRQLTALVTFCDIISEVKDVIERDAISAGLQNDHIGLAQNGDGAKAYSEAVSVYLSFAVDRLADFSTSVSRWAPTNEKAMNCFSKQAIAMTWDYPEVNVLGNSVGSFQQVVGYIADCIKTLPNSSCKGIAMQHDAQTDCGLRNIVVSTDPPYYDNIDYADLADFFYIWMRRSLKDVYPELFQTLMVPKSEELVASPYRFDGNSDAAKKFFEEGMIETCKQIFKYACDDIPVTIYYAYKQSESDEDKRMASSGWETMLNAIIQAGFAITGTWPMRTEQVYRSVSMGANALASSIILVCRKREPEAKQITRRNFISALRKELRFSLEKLQASNIAPVDLAQSAIGPGIGVFSKYKKVLESDGNTMTVRSALKIINEEIDLYFNEQVGEMDNSSRFCVDLYTQNAYNDIKYGEAEVLANAKGTSIPMMASHGVLYAKAGIVHLIERSELPTKVDTNEGNVWMLTQQLTHAMGTGGVESCAKIIVNMFGSNAERAKDLAYRLYTIAEQKKWANEAYAYNALVVAWPDIQSRAAALKAIQPKQLSLFDMM